eukprot:COSAG02_NODE_6708_length_3407_cov_3.645103_1_plen_45_part_10
MVLFDQRYQLLCGALVFHHISTRTTADAGIRTERAMALTRSTMHG